MAVIAGKVDGDDMVVLFGQFENGLAGAVGRPVDDKHDLVGMALLKAYGADASVKLGHAVTLIVAWHDDRKRDRAARADFSRSHQSLAPALGMAIAAIG
ncbi:hypothetical protein MesoLj131c_64410 [Mesorhizobium sp. 131-3-5]|nr:hypothetical protein MesoLj131b_67730 [Mesorhizobium sp. 131-2-5]BCH12183.1 hypothetical protein MesoLj131c_64410 [Mesorhizobium sp. 131-3-5]